MLPNEVQIAMEQLKKDEGLRLKPYKCTAGKLTIGYGRNLDDVGISKPEAMDMLLTDTIRAKHDCEDVFRETWANLNDNRKAVLINMMYNLGRTRFMGFKMMIAALQAGLYKTAAAEMLDSKWADQVGERAIRLSTIMSGV